MLRLPAGKEEMKRMSTFIWRDWVGLGLDLVGGKKIQSSLVEAGGLSDKELTRLTEEEVRQLGSVRSLAGNVLSGHPTPLPLLKCDSVTSTVNTGDREGSKCYKHL